MSEDEEYDSGLPTQMAKNPKKHRAMMVERFGPKDKDGNYKRWHYAQQGLVWDAMRELEERIRELESEIAALKEAKK